MKDLNNIPEELKKLNQWVCSIDGNKVPMSATGYYNASSTNPNTWSSFEEASKAVKAGGYDDVGFVFNDNGVVGIDIDSGFDDDGFLTDIAIDIISNCESYTEKSRSGRGFHILLKGELPFKGKNNRNGVEIYKQSRYFIMTGDVLLYDKIVENQEAIDYIVDKYFSAERDCSDNCCITNRIYNPQWKIQVGKIPLRPIYPKIVSGCRNICLTSLAGSLHTIGYSVKQILEEISYCNKVACEHPLSDNELITIVNSVTRYRR